MEQGQIKSQFGRQNMDSFDFLGCLTEMAEVIDLTNDVNLSSRLESMILPANDVKVPPLSPTYYNEVKTSSRPETIGELLAELTLSAQSEFCQMENMLGVAKTLPPLNLPKSKGSFSLVKKDGKTISLPKFIKINGIKYIFMEAEEVFVGGFSFVAFYSKTEPRSRNSKRKFSASEESISFSELPQKVALKATRVNYKDLETLFYMKFDTRDTQIGWLREFIVQQKLKQLSVYESPENYAFVKLFAAAMFKLTPTTKRMQMFSVLEAGANDFHAFFMNSVPRFDILRTCDINARLTMLQLVCSAAKNLSKLHAKGLHHGDVKLSNILINEHYRRAYFTDFDGSVFLFENLSCDTYTKEYMGPQRQEDEYEYDALKDDCWAFGICLLKIFTRRNNPMCDMSINEKLDFDVTKYLREALQISALPYSVQLCITDVVSELLEVSEIRRSNMERAAFKLQRLLS